MRLPYLLVALLLGALPFAHAAGLHDTFEQAWLAQPDAQAQAAREEEMSARRTAAQAWSPQPLTVSLSHKTDRTDRNAGVREWELEFGLPLWQPGERSRQMATADAESDQYQATQDEARWRFAGAFREAWWQLQLAGSDAAVATRRATEAAMLAGDLARRLKVGAIARVDANSAQIAFQAAQLGQAQAEAAWQRTQRDWLVFARSAPSADQPAFDAESPAKRFESHPAPVLGGIAEASIDQHPALHAAQVRLVAARARLALAGANLREAPELSLALTRERQSTLEPYNQLLTLRLKVPFGGDTRNRPRLAAANAELIEAQAAYDKLKRQLMADLASAETDLRQQQDAVAIASQRQQLAQDNFTLMAKAYQLGNIDLATRLRADSDRFDAEQGLARARLEAARAISRYNQALGVLP
ncbi:TolC family protein [Chitinimonas sp.]|uniref:TolC family protein n=1 Tax=Chitinimonas sp. TaxID=1934313 RepID=UPI0035B4C2DB